MGPSPGVGRERFFFATNSSGDHYGIVRWDASTLVDGNWVVQQRAVGLRVLCDDTFSSSGMPLRGKYDNFQRDAGMRIVLAADQARACPAMFVSAGNVTLPSPQMYDFSGYSTRAGGTVAVCTRNGTASAQAQLVAECQTTDSNGFQLGSFYVESAVVAASLTDPSLVSVSSGWVVWCGWQPVGTGSTTAYWALSDKGCVDGGVNSGSLVGYKDCYDAFGRRCGAQSSWWMVLCSP
eukprot:TRINITY_DN2393_c0_g1_i4.p3 TRINITY_DN2393_c0_g1~~TRINITY_DN2393_c0_g1_i4.p3  ORF type:complete len:236 (+),score=46.26 TRINITY_DN2393_c0_g1_i4:1124-1831(+)